MEQTGQFTPLDESKQPLAFHYDPARDLLTLGDIRFSADLFRYWNMQGDMRSRTFKFTLGVRGEITFEVVATPGELPL